MKRLTERLTKRLTLSSLFVLLILLSATPLRAAEHVAASCTYAAVNTARLLAEADASSSVTLTIPACSSGVAWTDTMTITAPATATSFVVRGAGSTSIRGGNDQTVIIDNYKPGSDNFTAGPLIIFAPNTTGSYRVYGITIQGGTAADSNYKYAILGVQGTNHNFRIDHSRFNLVPAVYPVFNFATPAAFEYYGYVTGVMDESIYNFPSNGGAFVVHYNNYGGGTEGDEAWAAATGLGTSDFIFFERNTVTNAGNFGAVSDCYHGGKFVIRFNNIQGASFLQTHPTAGSGRNRGCRGWEGYMNTITVAGNGSPQFNGGFVSSGTGVTWGNTIASGAYSNFFTLHSMRRNANTYANFPTPGAWGYCGTSFNGTGSNWDQNTVVSTGLRCLDQPGNGIGDLLTGNFPNVTNAATGCISSQACAWPRQALEPIREWLNVWSCVGCGGSFWSVYEPDVMAANREYYLYTSNFNGTSGVGSGIRAVRPATCTTGVGYWSTDIGSWNQSGSGGQGVLDVCTATNTWTNGVYVPYTFPHPLSVSGATLVSITPSSGTQSTPVLSVSLAGSNTSWANGVTALSFSGTGITVNSTTVLTATTATASIAISPVATVGLRDVTMTTGVSAETLTDGFTVNALAPSPSKLGFTAQPPTTIATGVTFPAAVDVAVQFSDGSTDTSSTRSITISLCSGTGTFNGTLTRNATAGVASFTSLSISTVIGGTSYRICAASSGLTSATSNNFTVTVPASTPTNLGITAQPNSPNSGATMSTVTVAVRFANLTTDTSATNSIGVTICSGSPAGTLSGTTTRSAVAGVASFNDLVITSTVGGSGYSLCFTSTGLTSATSNVFSVNVPANPCTTDPLVIRNVKWPTAPTGSRSLGYNSSGFSIASIRFIYPGTALFTDTRGCQATVTKP